MYHIGMGHFGARLMTNQKLNEIEAADRTIEEFELSDPLDIDKLRLHLAGHREWMFRIQEQRRQKHGFRRHAHA